jgi:RNA recognition motif-containing protein
MSTSSTNTLYVANLPFDATEEAVRRYFAACGGVSDVEIGAKRGLARVTMTSPAFAAAALGKLDRTSFEGRTLRVSDSPIHPEKAPPPKVKIVQQFRERGHMTYELDCSGMPLTIRVFPAAEEDWRLEAQSSEAEGADVVTASAGTRREALGSILKQWNERPASAGPIDSDALLRAMADVKAI